MAALASLRAFVDESAPMATRWSTLKHGEIEYVRIAGGGVLPDDRQIFCVVFDRGLLFSFNENVIKRAIDRDHRRRDGKVQSSASWLGESAAMRISKEATKLLFALNRSEIRSQLTRLIEGNIIILNEWMRIHPDRDPLTVHWETFHERLLCPMGGRYRWNPGIRSMESSVLGSPALPKPVEHLPPTWARYRSAELGLTFEHDGVRVKGRVELK